MWSSSALQAVARRKTSMIGYVRSIAILEVKIPDDDLKQNLRAPLPGLERSALRRMRNKGYYRLSIITFQKLLFPSKKSRRLHISNEDQAVHDIYDILKAYYKAALKRLTDNVIVQILPPEWIGEFSDIELVNVGSENLATSSSRNELQPMSSIEL
ncbi:hypothetical protein BJX68DRAFT_255632 [Aspergillus pseudodeflectus]|uniref:GED domain-containing protein n=1 Tax=Aspergillus pseudodeflectus TaxID=176178 RepID=A0ABR4K9R8_9EURO